MTQSAKKAIFALHRLSPLGGCEGVFESAQQLTKSALAEVVSILHVLHEPHDGSSLVLSTLNVHRFRNQYSPGLQELIEALAFAHFLKGGQLIHKDDVDDIIHQAWSQAHPQIRSDGGDGGDFRVHPLDYLLGILDLGGELMRFGTNLLTSAAGAQAAPNVLADINSFMNSVFEEVSALREGAESVYGRGCGLEEKLRVWMESLQKVEKLRYKLSIREAEHLPFDSKFFSDTGANTNVEE